MAERSEGALSRAPSLELGKGGSQKPGRMLFPKEGRQDRPWAALLTGTHYMAAS